jgi:prevent-host-death family protein
MFSVMDINIAAAKPRLSELVERAEKGEIIRLARRGKPVIELRVIAPPEKQAPFDWEALKARLRDDLAHQPELAEADGGSFVESWRKSQPY